MMNSAKSRAIALIAVAVAGSSLLLAGAVFLLAIGWIQSREPATPGLGPMAIDYELVESHMGGWILVQANDGPSVYPDFATYALDDSTRITRLFVSENVPVLCGKIVATDVPVDRPWFLVRDRGPKQGFVSRRSVETYSFASRDELADAWLKEAGDALPDTEP